MKTRSVLILVAIAVIIGTWVMSCSVRAYSKAVTEENKAASEVSP